MVDISFKRISKFLTEMNLMLWSPNLEFFLDIDGERSSGYGDKNVSGS